MIFKCTYADLFAIPNKNGWYITELGKFHFKNDALHSVNDQPSVDWDNSLQWQRYGQCHRIGGPAVIGWLNEYYLFDVDYEEEEYYQIIKNIPLLYWQNRDKLIS